MINFVFNIPETNNHQFKEKALWSAVIINAIKEAKAGDQQSINFLTDTSRNNTLSWICHMLNHNEEDAREKLIDIIN